MASIKTFIDRLGITGHPALRISPRQEGYRDYTFGCRAGPSRASVRHLAHELAHAAEFGAAAFSRRCFMGSFSFKVRQVKVLGDYYPEPQTCAATKRELRTYALQLHLLQHAGVRVNAHTFAKDAADTMVRFMHDWWHIPGDNEQTRKHWCVQQILDHHANTTPEAAVAQIHGWLDATQRRLSRQKPSA
jgi:hypothetical protein